MRDRRFIAAHRGGPLEIAEHRLLALWAAAWAERVLALVEEDGGEECGGEARPQRAVEIARAWARGEVRVGVCQKAAVAAHAAAREMTNPAAIAAARAAGHAVATAHAADHSLGAALYACKALRAAGGSPEGERAWQIERLPDEVRELVESALASPRLRLGV